MARGRAAAPPADETPLPAIGDALADPVLLVRPVADAGRLAGSAIVYANPAARTWVAGAHDAPLVDRPVDAVLPALVALADEAGLVAQVARAGVGAPVLLALDHAPDPATPRIVELHVAAAGDHLVLQWRDVTHVRDIEAAYRQAEQRLSLALSAAELGIYSWTFATGRLSWSDQHFRILGYAVGSIEPSYEAWRARVHPDDLAAAEAEVGRATDAGDDFRMTYRIVRAADGAIRWVEGRGRIVRGAGGAPVAMHGTLLDVTERRDVEAELRRSNETLEARIRERTAVAEERAEQLRQLALELTATEARERRRIAQLLHDSVQQTISAAKMRTGMMRLQAVNPDVKVAAADVEQMLDKVLSATRTLAIELHPPVLQEVGLVAALRWLGEEFADKHRLTVGVDLPDAEPSLSEQTRIVLFDAARELLFNVVKHAGASAATLVLGTGRDGRMRLAVDDEGGGIAAPVAGEPARVTFGLANLEHRVRLLRGTVTVSSAVGRGTRVLVELPIDGDDATPVTTPVGAAADDASAPSVRTVAAVVARAADDAGRRPRRRILVADDHRLFRDGVAQLLRDAGDFEVVGQADDGEQAVTLAAALRPDVCLLDVSMPSINGVEAAMRISQLAPEVRIVALSMHERSDMADAMRAAGAVAYLSKDVPADVLLGVLRALG